MEIPSIYSRLLYRSLLFAHLHLGHQFTFLLRKNDGKNVGLQDSSSLSRPFILVNRNETNTEGLKRNHIYRKTDGVWLCTSIATPLLMFSCHSRRHLYTKRTNALSKYQYRAVFIYCRSFFQSLSDYCS